MRLHCLIFAALEGVPFVALPYVSKVNGFIQELGIPMPPMEDVPSGRVIASIDRAWDTRHEIKATTRRLLPGLKERAKETNALLLRMVEHLQGAASLKRSA